MPKFDEEKQKQKLEEMRTREEETLAELLAKRYRVEYVDLSLTPINADALHVVPEAEARAAKLAVYKAVGKKIGVAVISPKNEATIQAIEGLKSRGFIVTLAIASEINLEKTWQRYGEFTPLTETQAGLFSISSEEIKSLLGQLKKIEDVRALVTETMAEKRSFRTTRILEIILAGALALEASDVHTEPGKEKVRLRYRLDGILTDIVDFSLDIYHLLLSRIKLLSGLKLNIHDAAQDGRFTVKIDESEIEIRTSVLPGSHNEAVVMRILNPKTISVGLEVLGLQKHLYDIIMHEIAKPNGMILTTGPTGSGKTTTLYAFLKKIHTPDIKIITIEDPIEYMLPGIVQTQTGKEYDFANGLRSALRQDPDVIMVGEIRDEETAAIAVNSSLTGHLVFSTLHTNNAAGTFPRLIDLGVNPHVLSSAVNIALAQRLVRKLCESCRKKTPVPQEKKTLIQKILTSIQSTERDVPDTENFFTPGTCNQCNNIGYKGRIGIFEAIIMDESITEALKKNPSEGEIRQAAGSQGILALRQDGILKMFRGDTSLEELERVIDLEEE